MTDTRSAFADPFTVAQSYVSTLSARDWRTLARLLDPEWLTDFRAERIDYARQLEVPDRDTDRAGGALQPPPELAEWLRAQGIGSAGPSRPSVQNEFAGVRTADELARLDAAGVLASAFEAFFPKKHRMPEHQWLGIATEAEWAHIVYRATWPEVPDHSSVDLISLRRTPGGWRVLCSREGPFGLPGFGAGMTIIAGGGSPDGAYDPSPRGAAG